MVSRSSSNSAESDKRQSSLTKPVVPPPSSKMASSIKLVEVLTNHFQVSKIPNHRYVQYEISMYLTVLSFDNHFVHGFLAIHVAYPHIFPRKPYFDGMSIVFVPNILNLPPNNTLLVNMIRPEQPADPAARSTKKVEFRLTDGAVDPSRIGDITHNHRSTGEGLNTITLMNLIIRAAPNERFAYNRKSYFAQGTAETVRGSGLEIWRGFFQSVRPIISRVLINVDTTVAVMVQAGLALNVIMERLNLRDVRYLEVERTDPKFKDAEKFLKKLRISLAPNGRKKIVRCLEPRAGLFTFSDQNGQQMTVQQYYQQRYNIRIKYPRAFGINISGANSDNPAIIPLECAEIVAGQFYRKKLPEDVLRQMVRISALRPTARRNFIESGNQQQNFQTPLTTYTRSEYIAESGMRVEQQLVTVQGGILPTPRIIYGKNGSAEVSRGGWNSLKHTLHTPEKLGKWVAINYARNNSFNTILEGLIDACNAVGRFPFIRNLLITPFTEMDRPAEILGGTPQNVLGQLEELRQRAASHNVRIEMIVALLPEHAEELRNTLKYWGDTQAGILTQCMRDGKKPKNDQYFKNVALKINARLGGHNSLAKAESLFQLSQEPFMIIGADVSHAPPGSIRPSVAGLVYSHDQYATKYAAITGIQPSRQEYIENLHGMVVRAFRSFTNLTSSEKHQKGFLPRRVFFFRDGISEGEFDRVGEKEMQAIQGEFLRIFDFTSAHFLIVEACNVAGKGHGSPIPKFTYIVVGKRHHVVFFPPDATDQRVADQNGNVHAGFVTRTGLNNPLKQDFYLQSHYAIQGTARSSHYTVLQDQNWQGDQLKLQDLAFALCHVYAKATRSVSLPAPVYYADLLCARSKFHIAPDQYISEDGSATGGDSAAQVLSHWQQHFNQPHNTMLRHMYFI
ncbi:Piwi domain-containing protein [Flagelloscypha sp. PMI_526]|nr:Piwi domain-containing protein [Flagelloscypha sp. PMI_526]